MSRYIFVLLFTTLLVGCSSIKTYPNNLSKNLHINTKLDSGSIMVGTEAVVDIFTVDAKCETTHEGRVELDEARTDVGLPTNSLLYVEFIFVNSRRLGNQVSAIRSGLLMTARSGYDYQAKAQYVNGIYDVVVRETGKGDSRTITPIPLSACKNRA